MVTEANNMFWGITLDGNKRYSQVVEQSFHVSMAALDPFEKGSGDNHGLVAVMIQHADTEFLLCTLQHGKLFQQTLDLNFAEGEEVTFYLNGKGVVHLSGFVMPEEFEEDEEENEGEEASDEEDVSEVDASESDEASHEDESEEDIPRLLMADSNSDDDEPEPPAKRPKQQQQSGGGKELGQKPKIGSPVEVDGEKKKTKKKKKAEKGDGAKLNNSQESPAAKLQVTPASNGGGSKGQGSAATTASPAVVAQKKVVVGGVTVEDLKMGNGPEAKAGKMIHAFYVGRLATGKVFDKTTSGKPFNFKLGMGEVIKGWDVGFQGMKVGGKRRITVPPSMGYGNQKQGPIPPNSTLTFEVELKAVN